MKRIVQPEILDTLPPDAPRAIRSRQDLHRINFMMRNHVIMARALKANWPGSAPARLTELGAGDGFFFRRLVRQLAPRWPNVSATLLDLQKNVSPATLADFVALGWRPETLVTDVFDWPPATGSGGIVVANLFLHHFEDARLAELLRLISQRAELFVAVEPRRGVAGQFLARWLWAFGCNDVTRHDAAVSVRAGFCDNELGALWPDKKNWELSEHRTGLCSHIFIARKIR
jgi:hypothetical protein